MKRLVVTSIVAIVLAFGPIATQLWANDAHHPEKAAKAKKSAKTKTKTKQKQPAAKTDKSKEGKMRFGPQARKA
jgi:hypothetical protein